MLIGHTRHVDDFRRLADAGKLAHGYLFFGPPRVGKTAFARCLAEYLETGIFPTGSGAQRENRRPLGDALVIEPGNGGTVGIDAVRDLQSFLWQAPGRSPLRTAIIADAELLTIDAQNALLKTLEEPPPRALVIVASGDPDALVSTIRSRLPAIYFGTVRRTEIETWLCLATGAAPERASRIARLAGGSPGLAWRMISDERFVAYVKHAESFWKLAPAGRASLVKALVSDESFDCRLFLEALAVATRDRARENPRAWHAVMELRRGMSYLNLNPRIHLVALGRAMERGA